MNPEADPDTLTRRSLGGGAALAAALLMNRTAAAAPPAMVMSDHVHDAVPKGPPQQIGMLIYPHMVAQDFVGPFTFLNGLGNVQVHLLWKTLEPITADRGLAIVPTTPLTEAPKDLDVLFAPGGAVGTNAMMRDPEVLDFMADRGARARYVTSVCTGSLILGAAGLLKGYRATSHWTTRDLLPLLGATPSEQRVVADRNRITAAGVTAGLDLGLELARRMRDETYAKMLALVNEYDPQPPFRAGTPEEAGPEITAHLRRLFAANHADAAEAARMAAARFRA